MILESVKRFFGIHSSFLLLAIVSLPHANCDDEEDARIAELEEKFVSIHENTTEKLEWPEVHIMEREKLLDVCDDLKPDKYGDATCGGISIVDEGFLVFNDQRYECRSVEALGCQMNFTNGPSDFYYLTRGEDDNSFFILIEPDFRIFQLSDYQTTSIFDEEGSDNGGISQMFTRNEELPQIRPIETGSSTQQRSAVKKKTITNKEPRYERTIWKVDKV